MLWSQLPKTLFFQFFFKTSPCGCSLGFCPLQILRLTPHVLDFVTWQHLNYSTQFHATFLLLQSKAECLLCLCGVTVNHVQEKPIHIQGMLVGMQTVTQKVPKRLIVQYFRRGAAHRRQTHHREMLGKDSRKGESSKTRYSWIKNTLSRPKPLTSVWQTTFHFFIFISILSWLLWKTLSYINNLQLIFLCNIWFINSYKC